MAKSANSKSVTPLKSNRSQTFETYWDETDVEEGLLNGSLFEVNIWQSFLSIVFLNYSLFCFFQGVLRINPKNYKEAYISSPVSIKVQLVNSYHYCVCY